MKINEVTEASRYSTEPGASGDDRIRRLQQMSRAGIDVSKGTTEIGRGMYSGIDPEDLKSQDLRKGTRDLERRLDKEREEAERAERRRARQQQSDEYYRSRRDAGKEAGEKEKEERELKRAERIIRAKERRKRADKLDKNDPNRGYKRDSIGRVLRDPRYYKDGKLPSGANVKRGAIRKAIDSFRIDPINTVTDFYADRVDDIKNFLRQEY